jgi:CrcB protein
MIKISLIAVAGALGAVSRFTLSMAVHSVMGGNLPYGTFIVNMVGCFLLGFIMQFSITTGKFNAHLNTAITIGFLGALTTFSTFSYETVQCIQQGSWFWATLNAAGNLFVGLILTFAGIGIARFIFG